MLSVPVPFWAEVFSAWAEILSARAEIDFGPAEIVVGLDFSVWTGVFSARAEAFSARAGGPDRLETRPIGTGEIAAANSRDFLPGIENPRNPGISGKGYPFGRGFPRFPWILHHFRSKVHLWETKALSVFPLHEVNCQAKKEPAQFSMSPPPSLPSLPISCAKSWAGKYEPHVLCTNLSHSHSFQLHNKS